MNNRKVTLLLIPLTLFVVAFASIGCGRNTTPISGAFAPEIQPLPAGLASYEAMPIPADNPMTPEKVALGRQLLFDERLSIDNSKSCYSCHVCEKGLTDGLAKAIGPGNRQLPRCSPTLWNIGYHKEFYWDGRSDSLEKQAMAAWKGGNMAVGEKTGEIAAKINALQDYRTQFQKVFQSDATPENMMQAIAAYERTIISGSTAWDRWRAGDQSAMSESAVRGWNNFQAIKMFTAWPAYAVFEEKLLGSIETGKLADFTILSADIMKIPEMEILKTRCVMTVIGGEIVHEAK